MISLEKWIILTPLQKLPNNVCNLGRIIVATGFEWLPKVQNIAQSGHTDWWGDWRPCLTSKKAKMPGTVFQLHNNSKVHDAPKSTVILCLYRTGSVSDVGTHNGKKSHLGCWLKEQWSWAVVVAQRLVERSLLTTEVHGSNTVIGIFYMYYPLYLKDENKEKDSKNVPIEKQCLPFSRESKTHVLQHHSLPFHI